MTDIIDRPTTVPTETVTKIKPSEALRLGRLIRPDHAQHMYLYGDTAACAVGAIHVGWGGGTNVDRSDWLNSAAGVPDDLLNTMNRLMGWSTISTMYENAEMSGQDGDAVVLAYLEGQGQ